MSIKKILLTGDDGYTSTGTRLLVEALKNDFELTIAATLEQQSAMGGRMNLQGFEWGKDVVDGVPAYWVNGSPVDAMELMKSIYSEPETFDLVISGINWGANLSTSVFSSGTVNAALRAAGVQLAPHVLAMSWDLPADMYLLKHQKDAGLELYEYPKKMIRPILDFLIKEDFLAAPLVNLNFPQKATQTYRITEIAPDITKVFDYDADAVAKNLEDGHYSYAGSRRTDEKLPLDWDVGAINAGYIAISPCLTNLSHQSVLGNCTTRQGQFSK